MSNIETITCSACGGPEDSLDSPAMQFKCDYCGTINRPMQTMQTESVGEDVAPIAVPAENTPSKNGKSSAKPSSSHNHRKESNFTTRKEAIIYGGIMLGFFAIFATLAFSDAQSLCSRGIEQSICPHTPEPTTPFIPSTPTPWVETDWTHIPLRSGVCHTYYGEDYEFYQRQTWYDNKPVIEYNCLTETP